VIYRYVCAAGILHAFCHFAKGMDILGDEWDWRTVVACVLIGWLLKIFRGAIKRRGTADTQHSA
jgi:hypothetical protein